jgi:glycine/D-amino acid oxidase-like deaminating enzyme
MTSVAILGGGVGGLTAAHELAERGFDVTVYNFGSGLMMAFRLLPSVRYHGSTSTIRFV